MEWINILRNFMLQWVKEIPEEKGDTHFFGFTGFYALLAVILLFVGIYFFLKIPVIPFDTDLWYHLNSGRYIIETKSLPVDSFFSFISPSRPWTDYFWLFQVLVYKVYSFADYYGLISLRTLLYFGVMVVILLYMLKASKKTSAGLYMIGCFVLYFLFIQGRFSNIRPHMFTYFFMILTIYLFEFNIRKTLYVLPFLAVLWANFHGITYPVLLLIVFSYCVEFIVTHIESRTLPEKKVILYYCGIVLSLGTLLLSPHGLRLLSIPFVSTQYASLYINELKGMEIGSLFSLQVFQGIPADWTLFNVLLLLVACSFLASCANRNIRISHFLMCVGGAYLLTRGVRFRYEFALLSLPLLMDNIPLFAFPQSDTWKKVICILALSVLMIMPIAVIKNSLHALPKYPFSPGALPEGIALFLNQVSPGGKVLNHPNNGGYLQWMLYPKHKIFMDMEIPFLFKDKDFFTVANAFGNEETLRKVLAQYHPSFITVSLQNKAFKGIISKFTNYRLIFFDNGEALYGDITTLPDLISRYKLKAIDPFEDLEGKQIDSLITERGKEAILNDVSKVLHYYKDSIVGNQIMAAICQKEGRYYDGMSYADRLIRGFPEQAPGYRIKGDALYKLKMFNNAKKHYEMALDRSGEKQRKEIYRRMGVLFIEMREYGKAYRYAAKAIDLFSSDSTYMDIYELGSAALLSGRRREAETALKMGFEKIPESDTVWKENYKKLFVVLAGLDKKN
ncbi:MAG: hypothetical protein C0392_00245 [Syntrophus sp. (in: bacteria)]|nr:hypothetical protein [Syntrophus sp. (in: bacteria)]